MAGLAVRVSKVKGLSGKEYTIHLEFAETSEHIGEEIRNLLKEKAMAERIGSMQKEEKALQSPDNGKKEDLAHEEG